MTKFREFKPGVSVKFTGKFLKSTGQLTGSAGLDKWIVVECDCSLCKNGFVAVNERNLDDTGPLHINTANLYIVGQLDSRNVS